MRLGRPVQWIEDRREHLMATNHSRAAVPRDRDRRAPRRHDRRPSRDRFMADMGAYIRTHGVVGPRAHTRSCRGRTGSRTTRAEALCVMTNKTPTGTYRGARTLRRRRSSASALDGHRRAAARPRSGRASGGATSSAPSEMPYEVGGASLGSAPCTTAATTAPAFDRALGRGRATRRCAPSRRRRAPGPLRRDRRSRYVVEKAGLGPWEYARVRGRRRSGRVVVYTGIAAVGAGHRDTSRPGRRRRPRRAPRTSQSVHGDSARVPFGVGGVREPRRGGRAAGRAARPREGAREDLPGGGARLLEAHAGDLVLRRRRPRAWRDGPGPCRCVTSPAPPARAARGRRHDAGPGGARLLSPQEKMTYGLRAAPGHASRSTARPAARASCKYAIAYDVGRAINPMMVEGQIVAASPRDWAPRCSRSWPTTRTASSWRGR